MAARNVRSDGCDRPWSSVSYAVTLTTPAPRMLSFLDGVLLLRHDGARLVLYDAHDSVIDARYLREGESVTVGDSIEFPAHFVKVLTDCLPAAPLTSVLGVSVRQDPPLADITFVTEPVIDTIGARTSGGSPSSPTATAPGLQEAQVRVGEIAKHTSSFDLRSIFSHFWTNPRASATSPSSDSSDSFEWWPGKIGGDSRSFAQVVSSPSRVVNQSAATPSPRPMGDRGGRFSSNGGIRGGGNDGGRIPSAGRSDRANRNNVWQRDRQGGSGGNSGGGSERWDATAAAAATREGQGTGNKEKFLAAKQGGGGDARALVSTLDQALPSSNPACLNCDNKGHFTARCATIRCERCGKLGHISHICQAIIPWECVASMCGFQTPGQGFFYIPNSSSSRQAKDCASSLVITVLEGNPLARDIELEFTEYLGTSWRCMARAINTTQYIMRFPNPREVERGCHFGKCMEMKTFNAVLNLSPWTAAIGASGRLHKACVRVRNIPPEKRCEANVAYVGSLVDVTLEVDQATLHKPEFCRILLGCKDVDQLPESAEGVLGDFFYIFSYEVESVLVQGPVADRTVIPMSSSPSHPSPKRARVEVTTATSAASSDDLTGATSHSVGAEYGRSYSQALPTMVEQESEEESEVETELLIDKIAREKK
ncbi:hypothetical protein ACQ4PT_009788 [Festuca glaucescens]